MPAKTHAITGHEANCLAAADHFIACRGSKPATRIRARFDRIDQAEAFAATFGDSRTMIYAVTAEGRSAHIKNARRRPRCSPISPPSRSTASPSACGPADLAQGKVAPI